MKNNMLGKTIIGILTCGLWISSPLAQTTEPKTSGYLKTSFTAQDDNVSTFRISNARIKLSGPIDGYTNYTIFVDAVRDDILLDAYVARSVTSSLSVKAGQFKTPYGNDNLISGTAYPFINRGYLKRLVSPAFRDIGVQLTYSQERLSACAAVLNGSGPNRDDANNTKNVVYRIAGIVTPWMRISGNYSCGRAASDGALTEYYDAGVDGHCDHVAYGCECACKCHKGVRSTALAGWFTYDIAVHLKTASLVTPAFKYEAYNADNERDNDMISCYTIGMAIHRDSRNSNRIMINYMLNNFESSEYEDSVGIEYMVRY